MKPVPITTSPAAVDGRCPRCGSALGNFGLERLCGPCLFGSGLGEEDLSTDSGDAPVSGLRRLGDYELLGEIARGGMGIVFRARQISLNRIVALKMILRGEFADPASLARFRQEAEAAAHLKHPNIVAIHEVGESDGQHFFSMDYVEGRNLSALVREGPVSPTEAARYVEKIALAVHYAHEQGVLHRDLKPSNVLLDANNEPHVTDFGLAKKVEGTGESGREGGEHASRDESERSIQDFSDSLTLSGQVLGTPSFMSPEQAAGRRGQVGRRTDVYSLGAILYHLLTARPPFVGGELHIILDQVIHADVVSLRLLNPDIPPDLETIVLKCLEKDPDRRYASALEFAEDIARQLRHEPIRAVRPSAVYRARKFVRRHRLGVGVAAGVLLLLSAATVISTAFAIKATRQRSRAESAESQAEAKAKEAQLNAEEAKTQAEETQAVLVFFRDNVLAAARPLGREGGLGYDVTVRRAVESAESQVPLLFTNRPRIEVKIRDSLGQTYGYLGEYTNAIRQFQRVLALVEEHSGPQHADTVRTMGSLGRAYRSAGQISNALPILLKALEVSRAKWGSNATETLDAMSDLASAYSAHGPQNQLYDGALPLYEEALRISRAKYPPGHPKIIKFANNLGSAFLKMERSKEAVALFEEVIKYQDAAEDPEFPPQTTFLNNLALAYQIDGRPEQALPLYERVLRIEEKRLPVGHTYRLKVMNNLGSAYGKAGRHAEAVALLEKTADLSKAHLGEDRIQTLETIHNLANAYVEANQWPAAVPIFEYLLNRVREKTDHDQRPVVRMMDSLSRAYFKTGRATEALTMLTNAFQEFSTNRRPDYETLSIINLLARHSLYCGQFAEAEQLLQKWLPRLERRYPRVSATHTAHALLGWALFEKGNRDESERHLIQGYDALVQIKGEGSSHSRDELIEEAVRRLVQLYDTKGKGQDAARWRERLK